MKSPEKLRDTLVSYKEYLLSNNDISSYDQGFINGVELALSSLEERPAFFVDKDGMVSEADKAAHPEHFI